MDPRAETEGWGGSLVVGSDGCGVDWVNVSEAAMMPYGGASISSLDRTAPLHRAPVFQGEEIQPCLRKEETAENHNICSGCRTDENGDDVTTRKEDTEFYSRECRTY